MKELILKKVFIKNLLKKIIVPVLYAIRKVLKKNGFNIEGIINNFYQYKKSRVKNIILGINKNNFKKF